MSKIIAVNQALLLDPALGNCLPATTDISMLTYFNNIPAVNDHDHLGLMPRKGVNNLSFKNEFIDVINGQMPDYDPNFNITWADITDARAKEIEQILISTGKQLFVSWSGGVDSTCIVVAILKNFDRSTLDQVTIACNWNSMVEYPTFYKNHVEPNFKVMDISKCLVSLVTTDNVLFVEGSAADTLLTSMAPGFDQSMAVRNSNLLLNSWRTDPDPLIKHMTVVSQSAEFSNWWYDKMKESIESVNVPIETYFDFFWWMGFNYNWHAQSVGVWCNFLSDGMPWNDYLDKCVGWFRTKDYQLWAMANKEPKHNNTLRSFKHIVKSYIYTVTKDEWYLKYKTKITSSGRSGVNNNDTLLVAITDDFKILNLAKNADQIIKILPEYLK